VPVADVQVFSFVVESEVKFAVLLSLSQSEIQPSQNLVRLIGLDEQ